MSPRLFCLAAASATLWLAGCTGGDRGLDGDRCVGGKCDDARDVRSQLDGLDEAIAEWLRESPMTADGILEADFMVAVEQIALRMDCPLDTMKSFVLSDDLVAGVAFPRVITTLCSDDETRAADVFIAASFQDPKNPADVDVRNLEMFAWDRTALRYVFYAALPVSGSKTKVQIEVEPRRCAGCHLNSRSLDDDHMPMLPIMNELTSPWPHWNAEPDFPSHTFVVGNATLAAANFRELTDGTRLGSAVQFEQIIRAGQTNRVVTTRLRTRRDPAELGQAMSLLRPLYCDEQINYVSEDHTSNVLPTTSVIAGGTREAYLAIMPTDWPWQWLNDGKLRFSEDSADQLAMIPVRGNADVELERRLIAVGAIAPQDVLRVRALDWERPVLSKFRCDLWKSALARLRDKPPVITDGMRNVDLIPALYKEIMKADGKSLIRTNPEELIAIHNGDEPTERKIVDRIGLGNLLQAHADSVADVGGRDQLRIVRDQRLCIVSGEFPNRPAFPDFSCGNLGPESAIKEFETAFDLELSPPPAALADNQQLVPIPDGSTRGVDSAISVQTAGPANFVTVRVAIAHSWRGDLALSLRSPGGQTVEISVFEPGDSADDVDALFAVDGLQPGTLGQGTWTLTVADRASGQQGVLEGWSIGINAIAPSLEREGARLEPEP